MPTLKQLDLTEVTSIWGLAEHFANQIKEDVPNPVLYDLGCGKKLVKVDGFVGVDLYSDSNIHADLVNGDWDFTPDDSVDMFYSSHFFEHVTDQNAFMNKAWRKLKKGGLFLITTPYGLSVRAWQDPDHKRPIFRETYAYFNKGWREMQNLDHYEGHSDFDIVTMWPVWNKKYATRAENNPDLAEQFLNTFNAVDDLTVLLKARK